MTDDPRAREDSFCSSTTSSPTSSTSSQAHETAVVLETLQGVLAKRQLAYEHDPDPAEQTVEELPTTGRAPISRPRQRSCQYDPIGSSRNR